MTIHKGFTTKTNARNFAKKMRKKGFNATVYKLGKRGEVRDWRVSVTRK